MPRTPLQQSNEEVCETFCYDAEKVQRLQPRVGETRNLVPILKGLADETRLKIAYALTLEEELCVCDVAHILQSTVATASHHLRLLKNLGLTKSRKEGKLVFYSLDDEHVRQIIELAMEHMKEGKSRG